MPKPHWLLTWVTKMDETNMMASWIQGDGGPRRCIDRHISSKAIKYLGLSRSLDSF
jgi:hypothetical protein